MPEFPDENELISFSREKGIEFKHSKDMAAQPKNLLSLLVSRIKKTFQPSKTEDNKLSGRVQQLNQTSLTVLEKLREIKELLRDNLDAELFAHVELLMDPMTREVACIQKLLTQQSSVVHQAKAFKKYSNWMIKAELWVELETKIHDKTCIQKTIIKHILHDADERIEQDLQVIQDYEDHILESLPLNEGEAALLRKQLNQELSSQIDSLKRLKERRDFHSLDQVFEWKDDVDRRRSKYFDLALHVIDEIIQEISPSSSSEEEHDYLVDVLTQIAYLEEAIPSLQKEIKKRGTEDKMGRTLIESKIQLFEQELHELNLNLRLTPELVERIQVLMDKLDEIARLFRS